MSRKILIDLNKCRECGECQCSCAYNLHPDNNGVEHLLEKAAFAFTCRRCESAPCIDVCPETALYKDDNRVVQRAVNLCVACHSCVAACPFGTMLEEFFAYNKPMCNLCNMDDETTSLRCVETCPYDALELTDMEADEEKHMYPLHERVLVKDYPWKIFAEQ